MTLSSNLPQHTVFKYFEQICNIPHGSGHTQAISNYLCGFAKENNLEYIQDEIGNVVIFKPATPGYESAPGVIIQGHMDMVLAVESGYEDKINMIESPLDLRVSGDDIYANHTSLGGDDGIAIAMALALLESTDIPHPSLEVIITVDEEVGMEGAAELAPELVRYNRFINLDNEVEGQIITGCAGGGRVIIQKDVERDIANDDLDKLPDGTKCRYISITLSGCAGGHSGIEIHEGRANTNKLMGKILYEMTNQENAQVALVDIAGGEADNAISSKTNMAVAIYGDDDAFQKMLDLVNARGMLIRNEYLQTDPDCRLEIEEIDIMTAVTLHRPMTVNTTKDIARLMLVLPNGVVSMSKDVQGLVETSLNFGIIECSEENINLHFSVRSSVEDAKLELIYKLHTLAEMVGARAYNSGVYPGWQYRVESSLRDLCVETYEDLYQTKPETIAIHAGLECGFFMNKREGLDCVSIGPNIYDIHTPRERLSIASTERMWDYLLAILKKLDR